MNFINGSILSFKFNKKKSVIRNAKWVEIWISIKKDTKKLNLSKKVDHVEG